MLLYIKSLYAYRGFILGSVKRDFESRYRNSLLGGVWNLLNPLATIVVYMVIFTNLMQARLPEVNSDFAYGVYIFSGVLAWGLFSEVINRSVGVFVNNANMLKKLSFPRLCLPVVVVLGSAFNFFLVFLVFLAVLLLLDFSPGIYMIAVVPLLIIQLLLAASLGLMLGVINVFFRDVSHLMVVVLQFWFWFTPIVYPISILPEAIKSFVLLNPMTGIVSGYQSIFVYHRWPDMNLLLTPSVLAIVLFVMAAKVYSARGSEMVDEL